jgi:transcriptional regulator GlxA family with amidase domain
MLLAALVRVRTARRRQPTRSCCALVTAQLDCYLSVPALAKRLGLSTRQLTRRCRSELGESPAALVQRLRLDEARRRLLEPAATVDLTATSLGFQSADVFRRAFERRFGLNPSAYRERFKPARKVRQARGSSAHI